MISNTLLVVVLIFAVPFYLLVFQLIGRFMLSRYVARIWKHLGKQQMEGVLSAMSRKPPVEPLLKALQVRETKNAKLYRGAVQWASALLWWPFVSRKRVYTVFNRPNKFLEWDPNPFVWSDLHNGQADRKLVALSYEQLKQAVGLFDYLIGI
jgi:hypothetical protein